MIHCIILFPVRVFLLIFYTALLFFSCSIISFYSTILSKQNGVQHETTKTRTIPRKKRHTEDQFPYNTYLCTIPDDFTEVPVHWHEEAEFIVIQKGSGTVFVDLTHYHVTAGDIIIVLPGHLHAIREISGQKMEYENIIFVRNYYPPITTTSVLKNFCIHCSQGKFKQSSTFTHVCPTTRKFMI